MNGHEVADDVALHCWAAWPGQPLIDIVFFLLSLF